MNKHARLLQAWHQFDELTAEGPHYEDYLQRKQKSHESPLSKDQWQNAVHGRPSKSPWKAPDSIQQDQGGHHPRFRPSHPPRPQDWD